LEYSNIDPPPKGLTAVKNQASSSTHKKVVILFSDRTSLKGYLNPAALGRSESIEILTPSGEHRPVNLADIKSVYFVREFTDPFAPERKTFLSRPKLDGLWVRLRFRDEEIMEGIVGNNLLDILDAGVQITPPDLHGNTFRMFVPRAALLELKVLGVVGVARRGSRDRRDVGSQGAAIQSKLFAE
jgi:hypothetical protein